MLALVVAAVALTAAVTGLSFRGDVAPAAAPSAAGRPTAVPSSAAASVPVPPVPVLPSPAPVPLDPAPVDPTSVAPTPVPAPAPAPAPSAPEPAPSAGPPPAAAAEAAPGPEGQVLELVNAERAAAGCAAVRADEGLAGVARGHSADMRDRDYFSHTDPDGLGPFERAAAAGVGHARAENIAAGQPDAAAVMAAWMASPGHRANILDCDLGALGVGVVTGPGGPWWTQLFG